MKGARAAKIPHIVSLSTTGGGGAMDIFMLQSFKTKENATEIL